MDCAVYNDATLAGFRARHQINETEEHGSPEAEMLTAYHQFLIDKGYSEEDAIDAIIAIKAECDLLSQQAEKKFLDSVLPGDIILEHYTPYALGPIVGGGLKSKDEHAVTSVNRRSKYVHFTSRGDVAGAWGTDISSYTGVRAQTLRKLDENPDLVPMSGVFTLPLATAIEKGLKAAHFSPKVIEGRPYINDIVLADSEGRTASVSLDNLNFTPTVMSDPNGLLDHRAARLPYDVAIKKRIEELRNLYEPNSEVEWSAFVETNLDRVGIAKQVLIDQGANPVWASEHVRSLQEAHQVSDKWRGGLIVPLAPAKMDKEHVDGKLDGSDQQTVFLGLVESMA